MGLREKVESEISISDIISLDTLKDSIACPYRVAANDVRRMAEQLLAFRMTIEPRDQELDDANMRAADAEMNSAAGWSKSRRTKR